jgi:hypothetical protein
MRTLDRLIAEVADLEGGSIDCKFRPGVSLFELARFMGTSVDQIDKTYGHLLPEAISRTRTALDAFVARDAATRVQER